MSMKILIITDQLRAKVKNHGNYGKIADDSGVDVSWLSKFAVGATRNPTINRLAKVEAYFDKYDPTSLETK